MTTAEAYEKILVELANGPTTLDDLSARTKLAHHVVNQHVLDLRMKGRVSMETARIKNKGKVVLYSLKLKGAA